MEPSHVPSTAAKRTFGPTHYERQVLQVADIRRGVHSTVSNGPNRIGCQVKQRDDRVGRRGKLSLGSVRLEPLYNFSRPCTLNALIAPDDHSECARRHVALKTTPRRVPMLLPGAPGKADKA